MKHGTRVVVLSTIIQKIDRAGINVDSFLLNVDLNLLNVDSFLLDVHPESLNVDSFLLNVDPVVISFWRICYASGIKNNNSGLNYCASGIKNIISGTNFVSRRDRMLVENVPPHNIYFPVGKKCDAFYQHQFPTGIRDGRGALLSTNIMSLTGQLIHDTFHLFYQHQVPNGTLLLTGHYCFSTSP